jgi:hypothetical protein
MSAAHPPSKMSMEINAFPGPAWPEADVSSPIVPGVDGVSFLTFTVSLPTS